MNKQKFEELNREVREYLSRNVYKGYSKPFEMDNLVEPLIISTSGFRLNPKGIDEEVMESDEKWEKGLAEIGERFEITLRLDHRVYTK